jgi:hypothetical protein
MALKEGTVKVVGEWTRRAAGAADRWRSQSSTVALSCEKGSHKEHRKRGSQPVHSRQPAAIRAGIITLWLVLTGIAPHGGSPQN